MRWKAIYVLLALAVLFGLLGYLFLNRFVEWSLERALETAIGAKVEIGGVRLDLRRLDLRIGSLQIANPRRTWRNLIETGEIRCRAALTPLYEGKIVIEEVAVSGLMLDTPRKTDGTLRRKLLPGPLGRAQAKLNRDFAAIPVLDLSAMENPLDVNRLVGSYSFGTDKAAGDVRQQIDEADHTWEGRTAALDATKTKVLELKQKIQALQSVKPKNFLEVQQQLQAVQEIVQTITALREQIETTGAGLKKDFETLSTAIGALSGVANKDYQALLSLAKLPDLKSVNVAETLFGRALLNESTLFVGLMDDLQAVLPVQAGGKAKEEHERGGVNITFPGRHTYPRLLIEKVSLSARGTPGTFLEGYRAAGRAEGITSEPALYGRPMVVEVSADARQANLGLTGRINHISPAFKDEFSLRLSGLSLPQLALSDSPYLPSRLVSGRAEVATDVILRPDAFQMHLTLTGREIVSDYAGKPPPTEIWTRLVREILARIDLLTIDYHLESVHGKMRMSVSSNIDEVISARLHEVVGQEIARVTGELRAKVDARLQEKRNELEAVRRASEEKFKGRLNEIQSLLDAQTKEIERRQKELTAQLTAGKLLPNFKLP